MAVDPDDEILRVRRGDLVSALNECLLPIRDATQRIVNDVANLRMEHLDRMMAPPRRSQFIKNAQGTWQPQSAKESWDGARCWVCGCDTLLHDTGLHFQPCQYASLAKAGFHNTFCKRCVNGEPIEKLLLAVAIHTDIRSRAAALEKP